jgi:ABC-type sugar transport system permease subunit
MKQNFFTNKTFNTFNVLTFLPIVVLLIVTITPLIYTLYYSFLDWNLAKPQSIKFILFENYKNMFFDSLAIEIH